MSENPVLSYLSSIDWNAVFQWYLTHLNADHLILVWKQNAAFSHDDWMTIMLLTAHLLMILGLLYLLIKKYRETKFREWVESKRSQITGKKPAESQTSLEPKLTGSHCLKQAYNLHRFAMYDQALNKYKQALKSSPHEINIYLVGIKIISEMDEPNNQFIHYLQGSIANLRQKQPALWNEVAKYGRQKAPNLSQWQNAA